MMAMASLFNDQQNPIQQLQVKFKEVETGFKAWLSKQSLPVEAAVVSTMSGVQGGSFHRRSYGNIITGNASDRS
jgi:hypothetical protein